MGKSNNSIDSIVEAEKQAEKTVEEAKVAATRSYDEAVRAEELKLAGVREELKPEILKILDKANENVRIQVARIKDEAESELGRLANISGDKKKQAVDLVLKAITT